jgi:uncharacterized NAD-dependent epimerase/dehydratase family protein
MKVLIHHFDQNAHAIVRFGKVEVAGIYDERKRLDGKDSGELLGMEKNNLIITNDFEDLLNKRGDADLLITTGEGLHFTKPENAETWKKHVMMSMDKGLDVYTMSKIYYGDKTRDLQDHALERGVKFTEASDPDQFSHLEDFARKGAEEGIKKPVITFAGTSMNSGKITAMLAVRDALLGKGVKVAVVGTEPCSPFVGCDEMVVPEILPTMRGAHAILGAIKKVESKGPDLILVGSQTGLRASVRDVAQARAGAVVSWQILLGSNPDKIVLCSKWNNVDEIRPHLELIKNSNLNGKVVAIIINGYKCDPETLKAIIKKTETEYDMLSLDVISTRERLDSLCDVLR